MMVSDQGKCLRNWHHKLQNSNTQDARISKQKLYQQHLYNILNILHKHVNKCSHLSLDKPVKL